MLRAARLWMVLAILSLSAVVGGCGAASDSTEAEEELDTLATTTSKGWDSHRTYDGHVKWYNTKKELGIIKTEKHGDIIMHFSDVVGTCPINLQEGTPVRFRPYRGPKGWRAGKIVCILNQ